MKSKDDGLLKTLEQWNKTITYIDLYILKNYLINIFRSILIGNVISRSTIFIKITTLKGIFFYPFAVNMRGFFVNSHLHFIA